MFLQLAECQSFFRASPSVYPRPTEVLSIRPCNTAYMGTAFRSGKVWSLLDGQSNWNLGSWIKELKCRDAKTPCIGPFRTEFLKNFRAVQNIRIFLLHWSRSIRMVAMDSIALISSWRPVFPISADFDPRSGTAWRNCPIETSLDETSGRNDPASIFYTSRIMSSFLPFVASIPIKVKTDERYINGSREANATSNLEGNYRILSWPITNLFMN